MPDVRQRLILLDVYGAGSVAVREHPTDTGPSDYVLFVKRIAVGVIEAKRDEAGENLTAHEAQTARYANASDFEFGTLARQGGLQTGWRAFGSQLDGLMGEMNEALVA